MKSALLAIALTIFALPVSAQGSFGLAMHGTPKYSAQDTHVDYANPSAPKYGSITYSAIGSYDTLNPYTIKGKAAAGLNLVTDRLMARVWDEPFTMYPLIAKSYEMGPNRNWISFTLDERARFHDGSPITVDDVFFSFNMLRNHGRPNMQSIYKLVDNISSPKANTIRFELKAGHDQETALILAMMPIFSKNDWRGKDFSQTTLTPPMGSGPYKIKTVDAGRSITYERVKDYWAAETITRSGHHNFNTITYNYFRDENIAREAFKSGNISLRLETSLAHWEKSYPRGRSIIKDPITHSRPEKARGFIFNTRRAPFDDINVRKALNLLLDADWINNNLYYGRYNRINSYYPNSELAWNGAPKNNYSARENQKQARTLLQQSGWSLQNGKWRKNQRPLSFEILLSTPSDEKIALAFKNNLKKAGIDVQIRTLDTAAFRDRLNQYDFDMTIYYWLSSLSPGTEQILYYGCEAGKQVARWNFPGICDPEIDSLAKSISLSTSRQSLVSATQSLDQKLIAGQYMIPLFYSGIDRYAYHAPIQRPSKTPLYGAVLETWWMDDAMRTFQP